MSNYNKVFHNADEIIDNLHTLDYLCQMKGVKADLLILGGAGIALIMEANSKSFRMTRDIDVNLLNSSNTEMIYQVLSEADIQIVGGVMELPPMEDFRVKDNHMRLDIDFTNIQAFVPTPELLACAKLFTKREKDLNDLTESDLLNVCNMDKLLEMIMEYKENMLNPNDTEVNIHEWDNILAEKGI